MSRPVHRGRRAGLVTGLLALTTTVGPLPPPATAAPGCTDPPAVFPQDELRAGMVGTGYTVVEGTEPAAFDVEILGTLPDGIAPGIDFVLVKVSGPVIEETGGIAYGFSGAPVYIDGRLVGSISYGFWAADQTIGGLTPARPIVDLFAYPGQAADGGAEARASVRVPARLRRAAAAAARAPAGAFAEARQLPLPLAVSGLVGRGFARLAQGIRSAGLPLVPYPAASAAPTGPSPAPGPLQPGDALAAVLSYGDFTWAGIGTATAVCGNLVVAFGHPFTLEGPTAMGMSGAEVITVVRDPSSIFGPFKIATVAEGHGVVDQDRFAGVRGVEGAFPRTVPIKTMIANPDLRRERAGETDVAYEPWLPWLAAFHLLWNQDIVFDRIGDGTSSLAWTIRGTREGGRPFELERANMYFSRWDVSWESIIELLLEIAIIRDNPFEEVSFTGIDVEGSITQRHLTATIVRVLSASELRPGLRDRKAIEVRRGGSIRLRVILDLAEGGRRSVDLRVRVPRASRGRRAHGPGREHGVGLLVVRPLGGRAGH